MNQPRLGRSLLNEKPTDKGIGTEMSGDIMRPGSAIRRSPCRGTRSRKWEKLRTNGSSGKEGIPDDVIVSELKRRLNKKRDNAERTLFSDET
jgi:hypothetical protein